MFAAACAPRAAAGPRSARIQGFGSSSLDRGATDTGGFAGDAFAAPRGSGMIGFGNPRFESTARPPPPTTSAGRLLGAAAAAAQSLAAQATQLAADNGISLPGAAGRWAGAPPPQPGRTPPRAGSLAAARHPGATPPPPIRPPLSTPAPPGAREEALVDALCAPGGLRAAPRPDELSRFVDGLATANGALVASLLAERMRSPAWQAAARALAAVEAVAASGSSAAAGAVAVAFQADPEPVLAAASFPQPAVQAAARRVLAALGVEGGGGGTTAPAAAGDLLGDLLAPAAPAPVAVPAAGLADLMAGLSTAPVVPARDPFAAAAPAAPAADPFAAAPVVSAPATPAGDPFAAAAPAAAHPTPPPAAVARPGAMRPAAAAAAPKAGAFDFVGDLMKQ